MKYYEIEHASYLDGKLISGLNGIHVKDRELFFNQGKSGPDRFYDREYEFDYLIPAAYGDGFGYDGEVPIIADMHDWKGIHTPTPESLSIPISLKLKNCLQKFNLSGSKFYKARVMHEDKLHSYYVWMMLMSAYEEFIDFEKTVFNNYDFDRSTEGEFATGKFKSIQELDDYADENWGYMWNYEKLVLKPSFKQFDYHFVFLLNNIVSERLKEEIERQGLTGIQFKELPIPLYFSDEV